MEITLTITDNGQGVNVQSSAGTPIAVGATPRPAQLPESWWSEARQIYIALQDALARNDISGVRAKENWIGGLLKAAVLIYPDLDHTELMTQVMVSIQPTGESWEGIGQIVREAPLPSDPTAGAGVRAEPVVRTSEPTRRVLVMGDLNELGPEPDDIDASELEVPEGFATGGVIEQDSLILFGE